jgi:hypothetical protein
MPYCKNDPKKMYKGDEPSPKGLGYCAHTEEIGKIRIGRDNNKWIISTTSKGIKRWIKYKSDDIHDKNKCLVVKYQKRNNDTIYGIPTKEGYVRKFIDYNLFEENETKIPKGYEMIKLNKKIIENFCGNKDRLKKNNDEYKKIKEELKGYKTYFIHDNDKRPLLVYINKDVYIYKISTKNYVMKSDIDLRNHKKNKWMYTELFNKYTPEKIFIGKSIKTEKVDSYGPEDNGNTILLLLEKSKYLYIGPEIYEFTLSNDEIIKYYSGLGPHDVPYPIAVGINNAYYLVDKKYVNLNKFPENMNNIKWTDSYHIFYFGENALSKYSHKIKFIKKIDLIIN